MSPASILVAVTSSAPSLIPRLRWADGRPSQSFVRGAQNNSSRIHSTSGVKLGGSQGPLTLLSLLWCLLAPWQRRIPERTSLHVWMTSMWWAQQSTPSINLSLMFSWKSSPPRYVCDVWPRHRCEGCHRCTAENCAQKSWGESGKHTRPFRRIFDSVLTGKNLASAY
jgi:hypothetical protein